MGIWERMPDSFLDALGAEFSFEPPRAHGLDSVQSIEAMQRGEIKVWFALGGNLVAAISDTAAAEAAMRGTDLTVQVSTKLNRSHVVTGAEALILPTLGRTDVDLQESGPQFVSVEDSVCAVHATPRPAPARLATCCSPRSRSSPGSRAPCSATTARSTGRASSATTTPSATTSPASCPASRTSTSRSARTGGFVLPNGPRDSRTFPTATGKAMLTVNELVPRRVPAGPADPADHPLARPVQHHDVQPERPLPRHPEAAATSSSSTRTTSPSWASPTATASTSYSEWPGRARPGRCATTASSPTRRHAAAPPRTSPRRTCWSRWRAPRSAATRPVSKAIVVRLEKR